MSNKTQNWLPGEKRKFLMIALPPAALIFLLLITGNLISISGNFNQSPSSAEIRNYNAQSERNRQRNEDEQLRRDAVDAEMDRSFNNNESDNSDNN